MNVLLVGLGSIGQRHVRNLRRLLGAQVEISAFRTRKLPRVLTDGFGIEPGSDVEEKYAIRVFDDLDEALAERPTIAFICNPSSLHLPAATAAARAGCHLFIEKPLSHSWDGVERFVDIVERSNLVALVGYQMRFHPCLQRLRALLQEKRIGAVLAVNAEVGEHLPGWHPYEDYRQLYAARRDLGGGVVLSQIHELDYIYWLFGPARRVFALGGHLSRLDLDVEDTASILMECVIDGRAVPVHLHQDFVQRPPARTCEVIGDAGKIVLDFHGPILRLFDGSGDLAETYTVDRFQRNQMFLDQLQHLLACVAGDETPISTVRDGSQSLRIALAARESMATGQPVELT